MDKKTRKWLFLDCVTGECRIALGSTARSAAMVAFGTKPHRIGKMYRDNPDGAARHIGYVLKLAGAPEKWLEVFALVPLEASNDCSDGQQQQSEAVGP